MCGRLNSSDAFDGGGLTDCASAVKGHYAPGENTVNLGVCDLHQCIVDLGLDGSCGVSCANHGDHGRTRP